MKVTKNLNLIPSKEGISQNYSPLMIMEKEMIGYRQYCEFKFGNYVQAFEDRTKKNNNFPRTIHCIYLRPAPDMPNGHNLMDLYSGKLIN